MPLLYRRSPTLLVGEHPYYKIGKPKIALIVASKGQKLHKNHMEDPIGEAYNSLI